MSILAALTTTLLFSSFAVPQNRPSFPSCSVRAYNWTYNTLSQSPCELAGWMVDTCQEEYGVPALGLKEMYLGPSDKNKHYPRDACLCSTIAYSLLCACAACQGHLWVTWQYWTTNCSTIPPPSTFPNPVPARILIPHWAIIDVTLDTTWNPVTAKSAGDSPEISPGALIGASSSSSTGPTGSATPSSGGGSSNTRAIVGGAVGAIAALVIAVVILGTLYLMLRRRRNKNSGDGRAMAEDATIPSPLMPDALLTSTSGRFSATPWVPDVSSQVVSGPHQGFGSTLNSQPSSESPPQYDSLSTVAARPSISTFDQSRVPRLREK